MRFKLASTEQALNMMRGAFAGYRIVVSKIAESAQEAAWSDVADFMEQFEGDTEWETQLEVIIARGIAKGWKLS